MTTVPVVKRKRDWFWILRTLTKHGCSMAEVARACGRSTSAVQDWQYSEPKESDGRIVLALLAKHAPDEYVRHQAEFAIRLDIESVTQQGEQRRLGFVEVR